MQHALHFDLEHSMTSIKGHQILRFFPLISLTGSTLFILHNKEDKNVDVQHDLCFDLEHSMTSTRGCEILFSFKFLMGTTLSLHLQYYSTMVTSPCANHLREECRCVTDTFF